MCLTIISLFLHIHAMCNSSLMLYSHIILHSYTVVTRISEKRIAESKKILSNVKMDPF